MLLKCTACYNHDFATGAWAAMTMLMGLCVTQDAQKPTGFDQSKLQKMLGSPAPRSKTNATRRKTSDKGEPKKKATDAKPKRKVNNLVTLSLLPEQHQISHVSHL